jgi:malonyl-CoA O-methyltransferase
LIERFPQAQLCGIDASAQALAHLPWGVEARHGCLLRLPAAEGEFDGAICIEALEHALLPRQAIAEICRVVRPGGRILVIDKNRSLQHLSDYRPWERWFGREEVRGWLASECSEVAVQPLAHGRHREPQGLFWCWTARRTECAQARAA